MTRRKPTRPAIAAAHGDPVATRVLIVDDDLQIRRGFSQGLDTAGFKTAGAGGGGEAIELLRQRQFDVVLCDLVMPEVDGFDVLQFSRTLPAPPIFVVLTGFGTVSAAVKFMKCGASDFIEKPVTVEEVRGTIAAAVQARDMRLGRDVRRSATMPPPAFVGAAAWLSPFMDSVKKVARTDSTVLIDGETGTGKSAVAHLLWKASPRSTAAFVAINCAAIPETLLESELFGHVRGAFTGAVASKAGLVEQAGGGTLFLDEVSELKPDLQAKLLHLLQERTYQPVGSTRPVHADVRFVAATNRDLLSEVQRGAFRRDLYYRLNVITLSIPPLRERVSDVSLLTDHFVSTMAGRLGVDPPCFTREAIDLMTRYSWPGNVRELSNLVERMIVLHPGGAVTPDLLGPRFDGLGGPLVNAAPATLRYPAESPAFDLFGTLRSCEEDMIRRALEKCGGNKSRASRLLKIKRTTLIEKMKKLGMLECNGRASEV